MSKLILVGGSKGTGKSTLSKKVSENLGFNYINTGDKVREYWENFHEYFTLDLISLTENTLVDTHYAASRQKTPYNFEIGFLEDNLKKIRDESNMKKYVVCLFAEPSLILERRLKDESRTRCLELNQIHLENEMNLKNAKIYAKLLDAKLKIFENKNKSIQQNLKAFLDMLK